MSYLRKVSVVAVVVSVTLSGCVAQHEFSFTERVNRAMDLTNNYCDALYADSRLAVIKDKIDFHLQYETPPFTGLTNKNTPSEPEKKAIAIWGELRGQCLRYEASQLNAHGLVYEEHEISLRKRNASLIAVLYEGKLTYGEFARKIIESHETARKEAASNRAKYEQLLIQREMLDEQRRQSEIADRIRRDQIRRDSAW